jgi:hypothetical protein
MRRIKIAGLLTIVTLLGCSEKPAESELPAADLVVIDRDLLALVETGRAGDIAGTQVLLTLFEGRAVYEAE